MLQALIPGFLLGLISSFHCIGMCGPLALALPVQGGTRGRRITGVLLYNSGRIVTYSFLGLMFGFFGRQFYLAGFQQGLSVVLGIILLLYFILTACKHLPHFRAGNLLYNRVQIIISRFMNRSGMKALFITGIANGLLPCGMVYLAIGGALVSGGISEGVGFMAAFGAGTAPLMLLLSFSRLFIGLSVRRYIRRLSPFVIGSMGLLLILRGLNLDIPYISPFFPLHEPIVKCH